MGLTLVECLIAIVILSIAAVGVMVPLVGGHKTLSFADGRSRAVRLGEHLMDEAASQPYTGGGSSRPSWSLDGFHNLLETPGSLRDFTGQLCPSSDQKLRRTVKVTASTQTFPPTGGIVLNGKKIDVEVQSPDGKKWHVYRFVPEPYVK